MAMDAMDVTRYQLDPPPLERKNDVSAWRRALDNAHSQLEHQYNRCRLRAPPCYPRLTKCVRVSLKAHDLIMLDTWSRLVLLRSRVLLSGA